MQPKEIHIAKEQKTPLRFQEYGVGIFNTIPTKSGIKKAIKKEVIFIDGVLATTSKYIFGGEKIELFELKNQPSFKRLKLNLKVLFEDDYLAVIHKPAGILVSGNTFATITNGLSQHLKKSTQPDAVKPQPIHRLDYPTSGVLLIGKTSATIHALSKLFENKKIEKTYWAITIGQMKKAGEINFPIDEKEALSIFKVIHTVTSKRFSRLNLVELKPKTGRKHQLRKHLLSIGNPILGDKKYFLDQKILNGKGLYLHASTLELRHPITKEKLVITEELPKKFKTIFTEQKAN
jgi:23S rRNA pseudouridine1911/1915/1917 synthase